MTTQQQFELWQVMVAGMITIGVLAAAMKFIDKAVSPEEKPELPEGLRETIEALPFMPEKGKPIPEYVYEQLRPEAVTTIMEAPESEYGRDLLDKTAVDVMLFLKGGNFTVVSRLREVAWASDSIGYEGTLKHEPTGAEWYVEVWQHFEWRDPSEIENSFMCFLGMKKEVGKGEWEMVPEEKQDDFSFDLAAEEAEKASRMVGEFAKGTPGNPGNPNYEEPSTPGQLRYISILCMRLKITTYYEERVKTFGEAGRLIRELEEEERHRKRLKKGNPAPTGTCYEDAWRFLIKQDEGFLVHGSVQLSAEGPRVNHAWVEFRSGHIWEPQTGEYFTTEGFKMLSPVEEHRYTGEEAAVMAARTSKHGPWSAEERAEWL